MTILEDAYRRLSQHDGGVPSDGRKADRDVMPSAIPEAQHGSVFTRMLTVLLLQNSTWQQVDHALKLLRQHGPLEPKSLRALSDDALLESLESVSYAKRKIGRLRSLLRFMAIQGDGCLDQWREIETFELRARLLEINGMGPETADVLLLHAFDRPTFAVDAAFARIVKRHGWVEYEADYEALKEYAESQLPDDAAQMRELGRLVTRIGKDHCRSQAICAGCPLEPMLPPGGICEPFF